MKPCKFWINLSKFRILESAIFPEKEHVIAMSHFEKTKMVIKGSNIHNQDPLDGADLAAARGLIH